MELKPVKIPTKAMTLWRPRDPVARWAGRSAAEPAAEVSPGRRSHATETESGREESGQRARGAGVERESVTAAARKPARPKRRHAKEKAGEERRRRNAPARREEEEADEGKKTFGELGMAAGERASGPAGWPILPCLRAMPARAPERRCGSDRSSGDGREREGGAAAAAVGRDGCGLGSPVG
jgi:hypothetical protein